MSGGLDSLSYPEKTVSSSTANHNPWPDLSATEIDAATTQIEADPLPAARNPYNILPTPFAKPVPKLPSLHIPTNNGEQQQQQPSSRTTTFPTLLPTPFPKTSRENQFQSQQHGAPPSATITPSSPTSKSTNPYRNHQTTPWAAITTPSTTTPSPHNITPHSITPHSLTPTPSSIPHNGLTAPHTGTSPHIGVATRVWAETDDANADTPSPNANASAYWKTRLREQRAGTATAAGGEGTGMGVGMGMGVVHVQTSIARRSVEVDLERALEGREEEGEVGMGMGRRFSDAAS